MKGGSKLFIFAGVGLALVAVLLFVTSMKSGSKADEGKGQNSTKVTVVQAKADVPAHRVLTIEDVIEAEVDSSAVPPDAVSSISEVVGNAYSVSLVAGQTVVRAQIEVPGLRNDIASGKRAIALPVDVVSAMSGLVQDGDYIDIVFHARLNLVRQLPSAAAWLPEDADYEIKDPPILAPEDAPEESYPIAGDDGSIFQIRDDVGEVGQLQPVAKVILQDIRILRVVRPGESYLGNGMPAATTGDTNGASNSETASLAQFILEVSPAQAEVIAFIQDERSEYQVVVRGKDDHETVTTSGITFSLLATNEEWALPWPKSVVAPDEGADAEGTATAKKKESNSDG